MRTAIVMIAHGSRRPEANAELVALARLVAERLPAATVAPAFLELAEPTIPAAVRSCIDAGAERVLMFPFFLSAGMHVTRDLEDFRRQFADDFPRVRFVLARPLGAHPGLLPLVLELLDECASSERSAGESDRKLGGNDQSA
jgi:sirohydrochlorin ferrochelatase